LQTNIYDLLVGNEKSFKDAIVKTIKSVFDSLAKSISEMFTEKIMGFIGIKSKSQKAADEMFKKIEEGAREIGDKFIASGQVVADEIQAKMKDALKPLGGGVTEDTEARDRVNKGRPVANSTRDAVNKMNTELSEQAKFEANERERREKEQNFLLDKIWKELQSMNPKRGLEGQPAPPSQRIPNSLEGQDNPFSPIYKPGVNQSGRNAAGGGQAKAAAEAVAQATSRDLNERITKHHGEVLAKAKTALEPVIEGNALNVRRIDSGDGALPGGTTSATSTTSTTSDRVAKANAKASVDAGKTQVDAANTAAEAGKEQAKAGFQMNKAALGMGIAGIGMVAAGGEQRKAGYVMMAAAIAQQIAATMQAAGGGSGGIIGAIGSMFGAAAGGGVFSDGKKRSYQPGGIASGPSSGYPVMLHGTEAVVPLPDGKSIPVQMAGGSGTNNVVVNVNMETGETGTEKREGKDMGELGRVVAVAVQAELQHQKRPGGILSPYGAT